MQTERMLYNKNLKNRLSDICQVDSVQVTFRSAENQR